MLATQVSNDITPSPKHSKKTRVIVRGVISNKIKVELVLAPDISATTQITK